MKLIVVFTENNARILHSPEDYKSLIKNPNAVLNPSFKAVERLPPHFWKLQDGKIIPMDSKEQLTREDHINKNGVFNNYITHPLHKTIKKNYILTFIHYILQRLRDICQIK